MTDNVDKKTRSRIMSCIMGKNTKPEIVLRKALHARGLRYRIHVKKILGCPDLVFPRFQAVIFVQGCFWHQHMGCRFATSPTTHPDFWQAKFARNVSRDKIVRETLLSQGWRIGIIWECALRKSNQINISANQVSDWLNTDNTFLEIPNS